MSKITTDIETIKTQMPLLQELQEASMSVQAAICKKR